jgi:hypothetical protein
MKNKKSPLEIVKEKYGSKDKLVELVAGLIERPEDETEGEFKERLSRAANSKLLHLLSIGERVKEIGGREALQAKVAALLGHANDKDFVKSLEVKTLGNLLDMLRTKPGKTKGRKKAG